jgi:glyoxylase-like metal-dependent hydrolase (beta-lactamase superfamily II)
MHLLGRRRMLLGGVTAAALGAGCAAHTMAPAVAAQPGEAVALASGVYLVAGTGGAADENNLGRIGNAGFIVGERGVIAVDTGTSYTHGQALLATVRSVTSLPVRVALVTHTRPEFLFGGAAFRERGIPVRMHARNARLMASRCETCLKTLRKILGEEAMRGTTMYQPDQEFETSHPLDLTGRPVQVLYHGHSSGPGDIAVLDERSGVLFGGGLLDTRRIPDIQDSDLEAWKKALREIGGLKATRAVPGHGPAAPAAQAITGVQRYLEQLEARVRILLEKGSSLLDVPDAADLPEFENWDQYDLIHRRNASIAFLRFERELMFK